MITIGIRVDEIPDRAIRQTAHSRKQPLALSRSTAIDDKRALIADLDANVRARADDHVHVALDGKDLETVDNEWRRGWG